MSSSSWTLSPSGSQSHRLTSLCPAQYGPPPVLPGHCVHRVPYPFSGNSAPYGPPPVLPGHCVHRVPYPLGNSPIIYPISHFNPTINFCSLQSTPLSSFSSLRALLPSQIPSSFAFIFCDSYGGFLPCFPYPIFSLDIPLHLNDSSKSISCASVPFLCQPNTQILQLSKFIIPLVVTCFPLLKVMPITTNTDDCQMGTDNQ